MNIEAAYLHAVGQCGYRPDPVQEKVVGALQELQERLVADTALRTRLLRLLPGSRARPIRGLYLWGGVGRGKTFLMDLFFTTLTLKKKRRIHFHRMMRDVHARLRGLDDVENPLDRVAAQIARETRVLCFDEFYVSDIGDAMILARLLNGLFERGVVLVTTSNAHPSDLYRDGLQRERFLPAIDLIEQRLDIIELDGDLDYRLRLLQEAGTFLSPDGTTADAKLARYFDEIASGDPAEDHLLDVLGRSIRTRRCARGVVWFDFAEICDGPRSQEDYIEIARWYPTVIVSGIPVLTRDMENQARRFIAMVDEFYDRKVKLVVSAAASAEALYSGNWLRFEYERTVSRLMEMQSDDYLHAAHLA